MGPARPAEPRLAHSGDQLEVEAHALRAAQRQRARGAGAIGTEGTFPHVFVNVETGKPYTTIAKVWSRLRKEAGVPHLRLHDLRHSFASFLVNEGRTLYEVQQILGHSDAKVTERYAHLSKKTLQDAANSASLKIREASAGPA